MAKKIIKKPSIQDILNGGKSRSNDISNYNNYTPNDNTQVNNVIKKKYNTNRDKYLEPGLKAGGYRALKTTSGKVGTALSAVPIAVATIPALGALGEVAAPYLAKAAASTAIKPILTTLKNPWVDATLTSTLGAEPLSESYNNIKKGKFGVEDAINTLPVTAPIVGKGAQMVYKFKNEWIPKTYNHFLNERNFNTKLLYNSQNRFKKTSNEIRSINKEINKTQPALSNVRKTINDRDLVWKSYIEKQKESKPTYILRNNDLNKEINKRIQPNDVYLTNIGFSTNGQHYNKFNTQMDNLADKLKNIAIENSNKIYYNPIKDFSKVHDSALRKLKTNYGIDVPYDRFNNRFILSGGSPYTTGNISIPNFKTGKTETFYIPERFEQSSKYISGKYPFETGSVVGDPRIKHLPPQEYTRLTKDNIDEIIKNYLTEAKPFGSSVLVSEGKINHGTHDYDFIMSLNDAKNHPDFDKWYPKRYDSAGTPITYGYEHPKYGELDMNVIQEDNGKTFGSLANELSIEQNPKLYADWRKKDLINNKESDVVPQSAKELLTNMNPSDKTLLDMMLSNDKKHVDRFYNRLNYENVDEVSKQIDNYYNVVLGGKYKKPNIPLSEFTDPEKNAKMLQGLRGIDIDKVKYEPERVKMLVEYIAGDKFFNGRGVSHRPDNTLLNSMIKWVPETDGGTANGVGLNTVIGGDSEVGNIYASIIPKGSKSYDDVKTLDDLRNVINHNTGNIKLSNEDRNFINKAIAEANEERAKEGLYPIRINGNNFNLADVLEATEDQKGEPLKKLLNKIYERFNVPAIANREYGSHGRYASLTTDQNIDNIAQLFSRDIDRPKSISDREYHLSKMDNNAIKYIKGAIENINERSAYGKVKEQIENMSNMYGLRNPYIYFENTIKTNRNLVKNKYKQQIIKEFNEKLQKDKVKYKNIGDILDYLKNSHYRKDRNAYSKINELEDKLKDLHNERRYKTEKLNTLKNSIRHAKNKLMPNDVKDMLKVEYDNYHNKLKSQDDKLNNFKNLININNMINSKKDRKKYTGGGKVPYRKVWDIPEYRNGGKITNKQDAIKSYKKPIPVDKIRYTPTIGVRIPTDSELRRQKEIESLTPNERYEYRRKEAANERRNNKFKALLNGFNNTFGRAASLASLIYGGGWAANRLLRGNKATSLGQHLSRYMIPANTVDTYGDAIQFITDPSLSNGVELGAGIVGKKYRDYGKKSRQLFELGAQGLNGYNSYKFGGDVKSTPKRKYENNYIMKGTGNYVPKTPQEKVVVDLYNANYKSARKNMPREDALRQAHYRTTQQMMESGYGTSKQARKQNNFGGMGGSNSYKYNTIKDFTDHVDSTMLKNFKDSYKAPTLNKYINGLYNGRIGAYSETPIEVYSKEMKGTHPRTSKIIEQLNPDDYSFNQLNINPYYNEMLNPYVNYNRDIAKFGGCKRPKAFWGAVIGAGLSIASNLINKNAEKKAAKRQAAAEQLEQNRTAANNITTQLNEQMDNSDPYYAQFRTEFAKGGKVKGRKAVITDGGVAIPLSKNMSLLRGSTHDEINESGNTGIGINFGGNQVEAQNGEIVRKKNGKLYIYSDEPMQNGISPAKRVLNGENPDKVYNSQENYKRNHNIKFNGRYIDGGVASWLNKNFQGHQFTNGSLVNAGVNLLGQGINFLINKNATNKLKYTPAPIQAQAAKLNTTYNVSPQVANLERSRMRTNEDITRNTSSSVAALNRRNYANLIANDQLNSIYNTKNEAEHKMINEDRMNEQNVRNNNIQQYNAWNAQRTEFENSKKLAKAQNYSNLVNGIGSTISSTINEARKAYLDDQNLKAAAAPYGDGVIADLARNGVHADSLYADRLRKLGNPKTPYDDALRILYINSIQDPRLRYEFENDPEFAIPTPGNENYTIGRLNNINLGNTNPIEQSMINNNNYLQSKFDNDWWTRIGKRQFRFPILNTYNNKSFIKVPYRA